MQKEKNKDLIFITIFGLIFFIPLLGESYLFDWDEINFAEAAREMIVTGDWLTVRIDFEPFHEKPPFYIWLQAISMSILGINEFAARFPNAIVGIISLVVLYQIGYKLFNRKFALLWVLAYAGSFLPRFYFFFAIIDPTFNLFIFLSIFFLYKYYSEDKFLSLIISSIAISLAILTKGPVALLIVLLVWLIFWLTNRKQFRFNIFHLLIFIIISISPYFLWYILVSLNQNVNLFDDFIAYHIRLLTTADAGHSGPIFFHLPVLLFGCFPTSIFALNLFKHSLELNENQSHFNKINIILLIVVIIVFSIVKTKIIHYSSLAYFPLTYLGALAIYDAIENKKWKRWINYALYIIGFIIGLAAIVFPFLMINIEQLEEHIKDQMTKLVLSANVYWSGYEALIGLAIILIIIFAIIAINSQQILKGVTILFLGNFIIFTIFIHIYAPKIVQYTQGAVIEFLKSKQDCKCYIEPLGYKTYTHYFYSKRKIEQSPIYHKMSKTEFQNYLLRSEIDKPAYFIIRRPNLDDFLSQFELKVLYEKNGFVFLTKSH